MNENKEKITQKLTNAKCAIMMVQSDLMNEEGSCTEETMHNALEVVKAYLDGIENDISIMIA